MPQEPQPSAAVLDQDQSRAALGVITYLMQHTLPPARMQSQAQPINQDGQQSQKTEEQPQQVQEPKQPQVEEAPQEDKSAEIELNLTKKIDEIEKKLDEKHKVMIENLKNEIMTALADEKDEQIQSA